MPIPPVLSREFLQQANKHHHYTQEIEYILHQTYMCARENKRVYVRILSEKNYYTGPPHLYNPQFLVECLKYYLPGVRVEYQEITDLLGKTQRGIRIDWS